MSDPLNFCQLYFTEHTVHIVCACVHCPFVDFCVISMPRNVSVKVAFCHNKGLWYSLPLSTRLYSYGLAHFPWLMPHSIDSASLPSSFVLQGDRLSQWKTRSDREVCCHIHQDFSMTISVTQLECFPISNLLVVICLYYLVSSPQMSTISSTCSLERLPWLPLILHFKGIENYIFIVLVTKTACF